MLLAGPLPAASGPRLIPAGVTPSVSDPQLTNELTYLGTIFNTAGVQTGTNSVAAMGALQLAIWNLIDNKFAVTSGLSGDLQTDYNAINSLLSGASGTLVGIGPIAAYNSGLTYSGATVYLADYTANTKNTGYPGQNLISWGQITASPEPSTFALAGLAPSGCWATVGSDASLADRPSLLM